MQGGQRQRHWTILWIDYDETVYRRLKTVEVVGVVFAAMSNVKFGPNERPLQTTLVVAWRDDSTIGIVSKEGAGDAAIGETAQAV